MIASMTWQLTPHTGAHPPLSLSSPLPALLNCDQHQRHHLSSTCLSVKSLGTKNYRPVEARTLMTRPHSATPPPHPSLSPSLCCSALSLGCAVKKLLCLLILPMRAAVPLPLFFPPSRPANFTHCRFGGKLHNKKLCLPFASSEGACPRPLSPTLAVCVCRLRLILPHSFGSNLSCHAVIMTNKKRELGRKNYLLKMIMHCELGRWRRCSALHSPPGLGSLSLSGFLSPVNDSMTPWS